VGGHIACLRKWCLGSSGSRFERKGVGSEEVGESSSSSSSSFVLVVGCAFILVIVSH
jgi:hypothetical protein